MADDRRSNHPEAINEVAPGQQAVKPADRGGKPVCEGLERGTEPPKHGVFLTIF